MVLASLPFHSQTFSWFPVNSDSPISGFLAAPFFNLLYLQKQDLSTKYVWISFWGGIFEMVSNYFLKLSSLDVVLHKRFIAHFPDHPKCLFSPILCHCPVYKSWHALKPLSLDMLEIVFARGYPYIYHLQHTHTHTHTFSSLHVLLRKPDQNLTLGSTESQSP